MAKKSEEKNPKTGEVNAFSGEPGQNEEVELTKAEKVANEVSKAEAKGNPYEGKFKLADPETQYADPEFTLTGDQEKSLPENPSTELLARIRSGFITKA